MAATVEVHVANLAGTVTVLKLEPSSTVESLKRRLEEVLCIPTAEQRIAAGAALLEDDATIDQHVQDGVSRLQLIKRAPALRVLVTLHWTGMYGNPDSVRCWLPTEVSLHDACCAAVAPRGRGPFGCRVYTDGRGKGLPVSTEGLGRTVGESLVDGGELYIEWYGDKATKDSDVTLYPSDGNYGSLDGRSPCAVSCPDGYVQVHMRGYRCSFRGAFPPQTCVWDVLSSAPYHHADYHGEDPGEQLDVSKTLADLSVGGGKVTLDVRGDEYGSCPTTWRMVLL